MSTLAVRLHDAQHNAEATPPLPEGISIDEAYSTLGHPRVEPEIGRVEVAGLGSVTVRGAA